ncbi:spore germination protein [Paenibacillus lignilyticus]|uniref:Spore germination protein n=1 Tax=Paenibacillus lignilyticus TaxID=1172615 RepID=A0ABS5C8I5_9BACL|nr:spore germination protein [Paenibacillus lignilyticus]MBP3961947.1 spore germination protein [Paenibacillus lignilyticus]
MVEHVIEKLGKSPDFQHQHIVLGGKHVELFALSSLVDVAATVWRIKETASAESYTWEQLKWTLGGEEAAKAGDHVQGLLEGRALLFTANRSEAIWVQPLSQNLNRSINSPNNQNILISSQTGFIEDMMTNVGLIRNELRSAHLKQSLVLVGSTHKQRMLILSLDNTVDAALLADCEAAIRAHANEDFTSTRQVAKWLRQQPLWSPLPCYNRTESPHEACHYLKQGRIALLIEGYPEAIIIPVHLADLFILDTDLDLPSALSVMIIFFRVLGALIAIIAPAAYVALVSINPDVMKLELIYSIARSRVGVPYPSLTEALILLFIIEMLLEAIVRLPKSIGPAMTMVGGIILGQAVVEAQLVSNLLIIVLAASTIANFTIIGYQFALTVRLWRYIMLFFAALFGPLGIVCGLFLLLSLISNVTILSKPFMPTTAPRGGKTNR